MLAIKARESYIQYNIKRKELKVNMKVEILVEGKELVLGKIFRVISNSTPKNGKIKVELTNGKVGTVTKILTNDDINLYNFKFLNEFFNHNEHYALFDNTNKCFLSLLKLDKKSNKKRKYILIFSNKTLAQETYKNSKYQSPKYSCIKLKRNLSIYKSLEKNSPHYIRLDSKFTIPFRKLKDLEDKFKKIN